MTSQLPTPVRPEDECAWTAEACRKSQAAHGRGDDCPTHPHGVTLRAGDSVNLTTGVVTRAPKITEFPGHREGLIMNDLVTLASLLRCNAMRGYIGLACGDGEILH